MHLIRRELLSLLLVLAVSACGPEAASESTWMLGTFSNRAVGISGNYCGVVHIELLEDGRFLSGGVDCQNNPVEPKEYMWERKDRDTVEVLFADVPSGGVEGWIIHPGEHCNVISIQDLRGGKLVGAPFDFVRGAVCHELLPDCGAVQCDSYRTVWCEEPPPPCEGGE